MSFALPYTSGQDYGNVNGKCMVPNSNPLRRFTHTTSQPCGSGCCMGGGDTSCILYISSQKNGGWTGASGCVFVMYATNTTYRLDSVKGPPRKHQESRLATNAWDLSSQNWYSLGEFCYSRQASGNSDGGSGFLTTFNPLRLDLGSEYGGMPLIDRDHGFMSIELDEEKYIWGLIAGGHAGAGSTYGYCYPQCIRSTKSITDPTWNPSGSSMWINKGSVGIGVAGAYQYITTGKCSCHHNWYFVRSRSQGTNSDWKIYYSNDTGDTWHDGISCSHSWNGGDDYCWPTFVYDSVSDKTLVFVKNEISTAGQGYGLYWTDCHRMSGGAGSASHPNFYPPTGGFFATDVDPINVTPINVKANGCPCAYSGTKIPPWPDRGDLKSFDRYDYSITPGTICLEPSTRKIFFLTGYNGTLSTTKNYRLAWKTLGTTDVFVSSSIYTYGSNLWCFRPKLAIVSGNNHDKYMISMMPRWEGSDEYMGYLICKGPIWSSQSNWSYMKFATNKDTNSKMDANRVFIVSPRKNFVCTSWDFGNSYETNPQGNTLAESFLTFFDNTIPQYLVEISGTNTISDTSVIIVGRIKKGSGNVTLYYDTSDKGENISNWSNSKDCGTQYMHINNGWFSTTLNGLNDNTNYLFRFYISTLSTW
jgi:hypothetical protein